MFFLTQINVSLVQTKSQSTCYIKNNYTNVIKVTSQTKNRTESLFFKRTGKKMQTYKFVSNKIMTTH